jgi:hypothetical protein
MTDFDTQNRLTQMERDLIVLQTTLWGASGQNGVAGDLKAFRREFQAYAAEEEQRREEVTKESRRMRLTGLGIFLTGAIGIATFILTLASPG